MPLSHIEHLLVAADDIDATRDWYARVLGMKSGPHPDFGFPVHWMYLGERDVVHIGPSAARESYGRRGSSITPMRARPSPRALSESGARGLRSWGGWRGLARRSPRTRRPRRHGRREGSLSAWRAAGDECIGGVGVAGGNWEFDEKVAREAAESIK